MIVKFKKLHKNTVVPKQMTKGAACADVVAVRIEKKENMAVVYLGFSAEIPEGYKAVMSPRSSFAHQGWVLQNSPCQIDSDYRGEWMIKFEALVNSSVKTWSEWHGEKIKSVYLPFPYEVGDRVAQMWLEEVVDFEFKEVEELSTTERGSGGFGSSGK